MEEAPVRNINEGPQLPNDPYWLQSNNPQLGHLILGGGSEEFMPHDDDWERTGEYIGRHTALEELDFKRMPNVTRENFELLCKGICHNKSINHLSFMGCNLFQGKLFEDLIPFFKNNPKLDYVTVDGHDLAEPEAIRLLSTALQKIASASLSLIIELEHIGGGDVRAGEIIRSLFQDPTVAYYYLAFKSSNIQTIGCIELANALQDSPSCLAQLDLCGNDINDEGIVALSVALAGNDRLDLLELSGNRAITIVGWRALFTYLQSTRCALKEVALGQVAFDDSTAISLANSLGRNHSLTELDLSENPAVSDIGWRAIAAVLQNQHCMLEVLHLEGNFLNEVAVRGLAASLVNNSRLRELLIYNNWETFTASGLRAFAPVFASPTSNLEMIRFDPVPNQV